MAPIVTACVAVVAACYFAAAVVLPAIAALFLAVLCQPMASWLERRRLPRGPSALAAMLAALLILGIASWASYVSMASVIADVPQYSSRLRGTLTDLQGHFRRLERRTSGLVESPSGSPRRGEPLAVVQKRDWNGALWRGVGSLFEAAGIAVFVPFLALFFLMEREPLLAAVARALGEGFDAASLRSRAPRMLRGFFLGNIALGALMAGAQGALFLALGMPNAIGLGLVSGALNVIPVLGLPAALILPLAQGLGTFGEAWRFAAIVIWLSALHLVCANWLTPYTIGRLIKVNASAATVGLLFFGWLWGIVGFLLAVPLTALVKIVLECSQEGSRLAALLAEPD